MTICFQNLSQITVRLRGDSFLFATRLHTYRFFSLQTLKVSVLWVLTILVRSKACVSFAYISLTDWQILEPYNTQYMKFWGYKGSLTIKYYKNTAQKHTLFGGVGTGNNIKYQLDSPRDYVPTSMICIQASPDQHEHNRVWCQPNNATYTEDNPSKWTILNKLNQYA